MGQRPEHHDRDDDVRTETPDERRKEDSEQDSEQEEPPSEREMSGAAEVLTEAAKRGYLVAREAVDG